MTPQFWQLFLSAELPIPKSREFLKNLGTFPDPVAALRSWPHLSFEERERINRSDNKKLAEILAQGATVLESSAFPESLAECPSPPPALFAWGDLSALDQPKLAIVGTRRATTYGKAATQKFAESLAAAGITIVSGGALGIDAAAHTGALQAAGRTVAVLGTGIERAYPSTHTELYKSIRATGGCLLSQFPVGKPSLPQNFLLRNQIIAALADALLVVEAPLRSGSLSTATAAADLGKPVFVVPGNIVLDNYKGSHMLIREGATLVDHPDQILEATGWEPALLPEKDVAKLNPLQKRIVEQLGDIPQNSEVLLKNLEVPAPELLNELTMLELEGLIIKTSAGYARKP